MSLATRFAGAINFVSVPIDGSPSERSEFNKRFGVELPEIDDGEGDLSVLFGVTGTPSWGFLMPDGSHRTVDGYVNRSALAVELRNVARTAPMSAIDTWSEIDVRNAYDLEFAGEVPDLDWTGSVEKCEPGSISRNHQEATLSRVNWYRAMAGVIPRVVLNDGFNHIAQAAALTMYASGRLDHEPDGSFNCMTEWSFEGASRSNLHLGVYGPEAIDGYVEDDGPENGSVGHRRWILLPELVEVGTGDTTGSNALVVIGGRENDRAGTREHDTVMWPPPGFVPRPTIYERWSVSARNGFGGGAHVLVRSGTRTILDEVTWPEDSIGWPTLIFEVPPRLLGSGPVDVEISEIRDGKRGSVILRYRVVPID